MLIWCKGIHFCLFLQQKQPEHHHNKKQARIIRACFSLSGMIFRVKIVFAHAFTLMAFPFTSKIFDIRVFFACENQSVFVEYRLYYLHYFFIRDIAGVVFYRHAYPMCTNTHFHNKIFAVYEISD